jgi:hypothetical protein
MGNSRSTARQAEELAGAVAALKRKSRHSGKFWFSDPMVRPDPVFGLPVRADSGFADLAIRNLKSLPTPAP